MSLAWCDPLAEEPCQCEYDYAPGARHDCVPKTATCDGIDGIRYCTASENWHDLNCRDVCLALYGPKYTPCLCNEDDPENICGCAVEHSEDCTPGLGASCRYEDRQHGCTDAWSILSCEDGKITKLSCSSVCAKRPKWEHVLFSYCDPRTNGGSCHCEVYVDSLVHECNAGNRSCLNERTVKMCTTGNTLHEISCKDYCISLYGWQAVSTGCRADDPENLCGCGVESEKSSQNPKTPPPIPPPEAVIPGICNNSPYLNTLLSVILHEDGETKASP